MGLLVWRAPVYCRRVTTQSSLRRLALLLLLLLAACAGGGADDSDNAKNHGFYGGVTGGWSHP
jgi:hypothetical protein